MLEIYFIRHGESVGNRENRFRGQHDFKLNENGIRQAQALLRELQSVNFDIFYSSPLKRALVTAQTVCKGHIPLEIEEGFTNIHLGHWENQPKAQIKDKYPDLWQTWMINPERLKFEGMESLDSVMERAYGSLERVLQKHREGIIGIVTHRAVLKPLFAAMLGLTQNYFWKIHLDTASYSIAEYRPERGFTFTVINQNKHLDNYLREDLG